MQKYTTNLEISQQLKEAGFEQTGGQFYWCGPDKYTESREDVVNEWFLFDEKNVEPLLDVQRQRVRAFLTDELLELIPECYQLQHRLSRKWECYQNTTEIAEGTKPLHKVFRDDPAVFFADTPANALGLLAIHLKKTGVLKI